MRLNLVRLLIVLSMTALFAAAAALAPDLASNGSARFLMFVFVIVSSFAVHAMLRAQSLIDLDGLNRRERDRLHARLAIVRRRAWRIVWTAILSALIVWALSGVQDLGGTALGASVLGFLVGINLSYLAVLPSWFDEVSRFAEEVRKRQSLQKNAETALKRISEGRGANA